MPDGTLIGRDAEVRTLTAHLTGDDPVVLLTGPAGVGKSSVAEMVAEGWSAGPVFICDLASTEGPERTLAVVAQGVGSPPTHEAIAQTLIERPGTLMILDGADAALEFLAQHLRAWRSKAEHARFLITTRRRIPVDQAVHVELAALSESEAVALFESRARRARPGFEVPGAKAPVLKDVIQRLDRMPEAIGLAADRMQVLSLDALDQRLAEPRIGVGAGSDPRGPMRKAFDSAWKRLDDPTRRTLERCAVFAGPFDAEAAEAIVMLPADGPSVPTALASLSNHSLVSTESRDGSLQFWMLDAIRQFASDALDASMERGDVEARFATWYAALASRAAQHHAPDIGLQLLNASWANLMAAANVCLETRPREAAEILAALAPLVGHWRPIPEFLEIAIDADLEAGGNPELQARLSLALAQTVWRRGRAHDASRLLDDALRIEGLSDALTAQLLLERAMLAHRQGITQQRDEDLRDAEETLSGKRSIRGLLALGRATSHLSQGALGDARDAATDAAVLFEDEGETRAAAQAAVMLGRIVMAQGQVEDAEAQLEFAIERFQSLGDQGLEATARLALGELALMRGADGIVAKGQLEAALDKAVFLGDLEVAGHCHLSLGLQALEAGDERAAAEHIEGAAYAHRRTSREGAAIALGAMGLLESHRGRLGMAERRLSDATRTLEALGATRKYTLFKGYLAWVLWTRGDEEGARACLDAVGEGVDADSKALLHFLHALLKGQPQGESESGFHARLIEHLSRHHAGEDSTALQGREIHVEREGRWFQVGEGPPAELGHRKPMRRILLGLASARESSPGKGLSTEAIFEAGWPGERATPDSARNRVYVTIRRLRSAGLEDVLLSDDTGYFLAPDVKVRWAPGRS